MTKLKLDSKRFVRTVESGLRPNTQFIGSMANLAEALKSDDWADSSVVNSELTINSPTLEITESGKYDAYHQSSEAETGSGRQNIVAGMAIYQIALPSDAAATFVDNVSFYLASDKFCVGGLKVAAILSDSATPPTDWDFLRAGGTQAAGVTTEVAAFATEGTVVELVEIVGVLAETAATVALSENHGGEFNLDLSSITTVGTYDYLYLAVSLFDYEAYRREYWVEGSGALDAASIEVEFDGTFTVTSDTGFSQRLELTPVISMETETGSEDFEEYGSGIMIVGVRIFPKFDDDSYMHQSLIDAVTSGQLASYNAASDPTTEYGERDVDELIYYPSSDIDSIPIKHMFAYCATGAIGFNMLFSVARFYFPYKNVTGKYISVERSTHANTSAWAFSGKLIALDVNIDYLPDWRDPSIFDGTADNCIGSVNVDNLSTDDVYIMLTRERKNKYLMVFFAMDTVEEEGYAVSGSDDVYNGQYNFDGSETATQGFDIANVKLITNLP